MRFLVLFLAANLTPEMQVVLDHISVASLRGHLSFIASDLLEGRATPSPGLDLAAEYIASQFRRAGLEPEGDDGYFQTATLMLREPNWEGFHMSVTAGGKTFRVDRSEVYLLPDSPLNLDNAPMLVVESNARPTPDQARDTMVFRSVRELPAGPQVRDPENNFRDVSRNLIAKPELTELLKTGIEARVTLHMAASVERPVKVRNVAGLLRGSDPVLRDTYVLLTAHYDHVGTRASGEDRIYNGANDDGSGTVSVVEIAGALAALDPRPKRSVLFVTFFGEERGLLGSRYYGRHPIVPIAKTIAGLNLEQVGRTDASNGAQIGTASVTGFDFSELPAVVADAGRLAGVKVYKDEQGSDTFFSRSDNQPLADAGVPAHTLCVAFDFPDYHGVGDHWEKIDYANMAKIDDTVALALLHLASDAPPPKWNESNPAAKRYVDAAEKLHR